MHSILPSEVSTAETAPLPLEEIKLLTVTPSKTFAPADTANLWKPSMAPLLAPYPVFFFVVKLK